MSDGCRSRDNTRLIVTILGRIVERDNTRQNRGMNLGQNCPKLHCFGTFAGARPHYQGLRWLKPCQFQRNVYWQREFDKLRPVAQFQLLTVYSSWTRGHGANEPCLRRLQLANVRVLINNGSNWETFSVLLKRGQRLLKKHAIGWR